MKFPNLLFISTLTTFFLFSGMVFAHPHHGHQAHSNDSHEHKKIAYKTPTTLARNKVKFTRRAGYLYVQSNGIPDHPTGQFPNSGNPNSIQAQKLLFKVPLSPRVVNRTGKWSPVIFGVAVNGIPLDPGTAETWDGNPRSKSWRYEALTGKLNLGCDSNNAHVQPDGTYHYHGLPTDLYKRLSKKTDGMVLLGYAADGFPFYGPRGLNDPKDSKSGVKRVKPSYHLRTGTRPSGPGGRYDGTFTQDFVYKKGSGDLDECNGRFGVTPEFPEGIYHYYLTYEFPFVPRYFKGNPDSTFKHRGLPPARPGGGRPGMQGRPGMMQPPGGGRRGQGPPPRHGGGPRGQGPPPPHARGERRPPPPRRYGEGEPVDKSRVIKQYNW